LSYWVLFKKFKSFSNFSRKTIWSDFR